VTNFTSGGSVQQLATIVQMGVIRPFCDLLASKDWRTVVVVMDGLNNIMLVNDLCCTRKEFIML
jgi:importin subunit alpha-2